MGVLTDNEVADFVRRSQMIEHYSEEIDRQTAHEILARRIERAKSDAHQEQMKKEREKGKRTSSRRLSTFDYVVRDISRTASRELTRALMDVLGVRKRRR